MATATLGEIIAEMPDYSLTPEQANKRLNITNMGKAFGMSAIGASRLAASAEFSNIFIKQGRQKVARLEDIVKVAQKKDILTPKAFNRLLEAEQYKPSTISALLPKYNYELTPEQAARRLNLSAVARAFNQYSEWTTRFASSTGIFTEHEGQRLATLEAILKAANKNGILNQKNFLQLLEQKPYQPLTIPALLPKDHMIDMPGKITDTSLGIRYAAKPVLKPPEPPRAVVPGYLIETLPPFSEPVPNIVLDYSQKPDGMSYYEFALQQQAGNQAPFAGLEGRVAVYHPVSAKFAERIQAIVDSGVRLVYHPGLNKFGVITGLRKDSKSGELVQVSIDFGGTVKDYIVNAAAQKVTPSDPKIWGPPDISVIR